MEVVQVWGTQVNSSSEFVREEDIELKQADHLSDLLRDLPGVDIGGAHSTNQRINIRGLQDNDLEITIDGARQNNFMFHHMGNLLINADILKAVEVQVGTNSVINGGLGGGIAFETKDAKDLLTPDRPLGARVYGTYASNDYVGYSLTGYGQLNQTLDALAYFDAAHRDNPENGNGEESVGNDGDIRNVLLKTGWDINATHRLELTYDRYQDEGDYAPRPDMGVATNRSITGTLVYPTEYERQTLTLGYEVDLGDALNLQATVYRNEMDLWRDEALNTRAPYRYAAGNSTHTGVKVLAETIVTWGTLDNILRYGLDVYRQETEYQEDSTFISGEEADSAAVYLEDEIFLTDDLSVTPGVRYNRYSVDSKASDATFTEFTWGLAAAYTLNEQWAFNASTTRLFKGPTLSEVFIGAGRDLEFNPDLETTTGFNHEIGVLYSQYNTLGFDTLNVGLTVFRGEFHDYIDDEGTGSFVNLGDYDIEGFEASLNLRKGNFSGRFSYAQSESENQLTGVPLGRQVGDSISAGLSYTLPQQGLSVNWQSLITLDEEYFKKESYDVHNFTLRWLPTRLKQRLTLTFGVENILDAYYVSHASRIGDSVHPVFGPLLLNDYEPGRNIKLSVAYVF